MSDKYDEIAAKVMDNEGMVHLIGGVDTETRKDQYDAIKLIAITRLAALLRENTPTVSGGIAEAVDRIVADMHQYGILVIHPDDETDTRAIITRRLAPVIDEVREFADGIKEVVEYYEDKEGCDWVDVWEKVKSHYDKFAALALLGEGKKEGCDATD